jgi:hypothetical protein
MFFKEKVKGKKEKGKIGELNFENNSIWLVMEIVAVRSSRL